MSVSVLQPPRRGNTVVLVVDLRDAKGKGKEEEIRIELKGKDKGPIPFVFRRDTRSYCVEGVVTYVRIMFDLFPHFNEVHIIAIAEDGCFEIYPQEDAIHAAEFPCSDVQKVVDAFEQFRRRRVSQKRRGDPVQQAFTDARRVESNGTGLQVVGLLQDMGTSTTALKRLIGSWMKGGKSKVDVSVLVLQGGDKSGGSSVTERTQAGPSDLPQAVDVWAVNQTMVVQRVVEMVVQHRGLRTVTVGNIPMKSSSEEAQKRFGVELLVVVDDHLLPQMPGSLSWIKQGVQGFDCVCAHRVTPIDVVHPASVCLMNHVLSGKPAYLGEVEGKPMSHALLAHGKDVFLHCVRPSVIRPLHHSLLRQHEMDSGLPPLQNPERVLDAIGSSLLFPRLNPCQHVRGGSDWLDMVEFRSETGDSSDVPAKRPKVEGPAGGTCIG